MRDKLTFKTRATVTDNVTVTSVVTPITEWKHRRKQAESRSQHVLNDTTNGVASTTANSTSTKRTLANGISLNTTTGAISTAAGTALCVHAVAYELCDKPKPALR
jgi:hypothetical protein